MSRFVSACAATAWAAVNTSPATGLALRSNRSGDVLKRSLTDAQLVDTKWSEGLLEQAAQAELAMDFARAAELRRKHAQYTERVNVLCDAEGVREDLRRRAGAAAAGEEDVAEEVGVNDIPLGLSRQISSLQRVSQLPPSPLDLRKVAAMPPSAGRRGCGHFSFAARESNRAREQAPAVPEEDIPRGTAASGRSISPAAVSDIDEELSRSTGSLGDGGEDPGADDAPLVATQMSAAPEPQRPSEATEVVYPEDLELDLLTLPVERPSPPPTATADLQQRQDIADDALQARVRQEAARRLALEAPSGTPQRKFEQRAGAYQVNALADDTPLHSRPPSPHTGIQGILPTDASSAFFSAADEAARRRHGRAMRRRESDPHAAAGGVGREPSPAPSARRHSAAPAAFFGALARVEIRPEHRRGAARAKALATPAGAANPSPRSAVKAFHPAARGERGVCVGGKKYSGPDGCGGCAGAGAGMRDCGARGEQAEGAAAEEQQGDKPSTGSIDRAHDDLFVKEEKERKSAAGEQKRDPSPYRIARNDEATPVRADQDAWKGIQLAPADGKKPWWEEQKKAPASAQSRAQRGRSPARTPIVAPRNKQQPGRDATPARAAPCSGPAVTPVNRDAAKELARAKAERAKAREKKIKLASDLENNGVQLPFVVQRRQAERSGGPSVLGEKKPTKMADAKRPAPLALGNDDNAQLPAVPEEKTAEPRMPTATPLVARKQAAGSGAEEEGAEAARQPVWTGMLDLLKAKTLRPRRSLFGAAAAEPAPQRAGGFRGSHTLNPAGFLPVRGSDDAAEDKESETEERESETGPGLVAARVTRPQSGSSAGSATGHSGIATTPIADAARAKKTSTAAEREEQLAQVATKLDRVQEQVAQSEEAQRRRLELRREAQRENIGSPIAIRRRKPASHTDGKLLEDLRRDMRLGPTAEEGAGSRRKSRPVPSATKANDSLLPGRRGRDRLDFQECEDAGGAQHADALEASLAGPLELPMTPLAVPEKHLRTPEKQTRDSGSACARDGGEERRTRAKAPATPGFTILEDVSGSDEVPRWKRRSQEILTSDQAPESVVRARQPLKAGQLTIMNINGGNSHLAISRDPLRKAVGEDGALASDSDAYRGYTIAPQQQESYRFDQLMERADKPKFLLYAAGPRSEKRALGAENAGRFHTIASNSGKAVHAVKTEFGHVGIADPFARRNGSTPRGPVYEMFLEKNWELKDDLLKWMTAAGKREQQTRHADAFFEATFRNASGSYLAFFHAATARSLLKFFFQYMNAADIDFADKSVTTLAEKRAHIHRRLEQSQGQEDGTIPMQLDEGARKMVLDTRHMMGVRRTGDFNCQTTITWKVKTMKGKQVVWPVSHTQRCSLNVEEAAGARLEISDGCSGVPLARQA